MLLSQTWDDYCRDKMFLGYSKYTLKSYHIQFKLLFGYFGDVPVEEFNYIDFKEYLLKQTHLKSSSIAFRIKFIKSFFRWLHEAGVIDCNPSAKLEEPKTDFLLPKFINEEEIEELKMCCKSSLEGFLINFLYASGCRIGELYRLNKQDIDIEKRTALVLGKGGYQRNVYFNLQTAIWFKRYLKERDINQDDNESALIVTERRPIRRMSIDQIRYIVKRIARRSSIKTNIYPHKFRHSFAYHLLENGGDLSFIQEFLGHKKIETTKIYANISDERKRQHYIKHFK